MSKAMHAKPFRLTGPYTARHARPESPRSKLIRAVSLGLACVCLLLTATVYPASAATSNTSMASLQSKLDKLSQSINQHKKELSDAKKKESAAKALESELKERVTVLQDQISVLGGQIAAVQNSIGEKEQQIGVMQTQITDKQTQIEQKQNEIDDQWDDFKKHMAAMQELRDGGSVAMLGAVNDLYELLTFNEVMQDISIKDTEIMNNMKSAKQGLEDDKAALESELKERVTVLQDQISVLGGQIAAVQNSIGEKEQQIGVMQTQITDKQTQIEQKQNEIDDQWDDFKKHMAAMQELRDGGSVAMLGAVNDLYELLTFNEVMQDISIKDTEIMNNMKSAKQGLEDDKAALEEQKAGLEAEKAELQSQKSKLDSQNAQMKGKQSELNNSISAAKLSAAEAQAAQQKAQAAIESDELNYEAVKKEIQKLIAAASASKPQLSFSGFACPLKSYSRISSEYGWRKNPVSGVNKLHAGTDFAAAGGTPIYAAASGYVQVAGWSTGGYGNYVIIYHGKMSDGNTYTTLYAHMRSVATSAGKYVKQGELIGYVGTTGNSTGNHLHLEVWKGGSKANAVNPRSCIPIPHN